MESAGEELGKVKDKASCEAAMPKLKGFSQEAAAVIARMEKAGEPSKEVEAELKKKYDARFEKARKALEKNAQSAGLVAAANGMGKEFTQAMGLLGSK
jgi:ElaB/YqjD/DUF883 family membrane-anchored ribosome-binding protein